MAGKKVTRGKSREVGKGVNDQGTKNEGQEPGPTWERGGDIESGRSAMGGRVGERGEPGERAHGRKGGGEGRIQDGGGEE